MTLPSWVTEISEGMFYGCVYLTNVTFPEQLESIGAYSFMGCYSLVSVTIPSKVTGIGGRAFYCCWKLAEVVNNSKLNIIKDSNDYGYIGAYALTVHDGTSKIVSKNDYMFLTADGVDYLLGYVGTNTSLTLPADYDGKKYVVYDYAFYFRTSLTKVVIGDGVSKIGATAFGYCLLLSDLTIGNSVTEIAYGAFGECVSLTSVVIPVSVESLGSCAFIDCGSLITITIGNSVKSIGEMAFNNCFALTTVYYQGTAEQWAKISIADNNSYLTDATRYYYSATEPALHSSGTAYDGNYWHYDNDGNIVVWIYKSQENG